MAHCIIHVDGSFYPDPLKKTQAAIGWGVVAEHDDRTHEACGGYSVSRNQGLNGAHEDIALLYALQYMRNHGFSPKDTSIYCDDDLMGHAPTYLAKENYRAYLAEQIERRVTRAAEFIGQEKLVPLIMDELHNVRMHKVKGHQGHVYQERVDYLAKWSAHTAVGQTAPQLAFEEWLIKGLVIYMPPEAAQPDMVSLGLIDPPTDSLSTPTPQSVANTPYKPRVRIQYAPFVRNLLASQSTPEESPAP